MRILLFILVFIQSVAFGQDVKEYTTVEFQWSPWKDTLATIQVPDGFSVDNWSYGEGILTTLSYPDSSQIILQYGGNMSLPLLKSPEYIISNESTSELRETRSGMLQNENLYWREDSLKDPLVNIAFDKVPSDKLELFDKSLDSFKWLK